MLPTQQGDNFPFLFSYLTLVNRHYKKKRYKGGPSDFFIQSSLVPESYKYKVLYITINGKKQKGRISIRSWINPVF